MTPRPRDNTASWGAHQSAPTTMVRAQTKISRRFAECQPNNRPCHTCVPNFPNPHPAGVQTLTLSLLPHPATAARTPSGAQTTSQNTGFQTGAPVRPGFGPNSHTTSQS